MLLQTNGWVTNLKSAVSERLDGMRANILEQLEAQRTQIAAQQALQAAKTVTVSNNAIVEQPFNITVNNSFNKPQSASFTKEEFQEIMGKVKGTSSATAIPGEEDLKVIFNKAEGQDKVDIKIDTTDDAFEALQALFNHIFPTTGAFERATPVELKFRRLLLAFRSDFKV